MKALRIRTVLVLAAGLFIAVLADAAARAKSSAAVKDEFFIISSVDIAKKQIVLKRPTEVTELMGVTDSTSFVDEEGKPLRFQDLRAGDTVYVTASSPSQGRRVVLRLRRGPMTLEELHRRYPER